VCFRKVKDERYQIILFDINSGSEFEIIFGKYENKKEKSEVFKIPGNYHNCPFENELTLSYIEQVNVLSNENTRS